MNQILGTIDKVAGYLAALSLIFVLLITSIDMNCFDRDFFSSSYHKLHTAEELGMTEHDLNSATSVLLDYLQDERKDIKVDVTVQGIKMEAFNTKEQAHMKDVRNLYHFAKSFRLFNLMVFVIAVGYLLIRLRKGALTLLSIHYMKTAILFAIFIIMLAGWAYVDFDAFWTTFHRLVFRNELWLLDPNTDLMINLFPSAFFSSLVFRIVGMFVAAFAAIFAGGYFYLRHQLKKLQQEQGHA